MERICQQALLQWAMAARISRQKDRNMDDEGEGEGGGGRDTGHGRQGGLAPTRRQAEEGRKLILAHGPQGMCVFAEVDQDATATEQQSIHQRRISPGSMSSQRHHGPVVQEHAVASPPA